MGLWDLLKKAVGSPEPPRAFEAACNQSAPLLVPARATIANDFATVLSAATAPGPVIVGAPREVTRVLASDVDELLSLCAVAVSCERIVSETGSLLPCHHSPTQRQAQKQAGAKQQRGSNGHVCDIAVFHLRTPASVQWLLADDPTSLQMWRTVDAVRWIAGAGMLGVLADHRFYLLKVGTQPGEAAFLMLKVESITATCIARSAYPCPTLPSMFIGQAGGNVLCAKVNREGVASASDCALLSRSLTQPFFDDSFTVAGIVHSPHNGDVLLVAYCSAHDIVDEVSRVATACVLFSISRAAPLAILTPLTKPPVLGATSMPAAAQRPLILVQSLCFDAHWAPSSGGATDMAATSVVGLTRDGHAMSWKHDMATLGSKPVVLPPTATASIFAGAPAGSTTLESVRLQPATVLPQQPGQAADATNFAVHIFLAQHTHTVPQHSVPVNSVYAQQQQASPTDAASAVSCIAVRVSGNGALIIGTCRACPVVSNMLRVSPWSSGASSLSSSVSAVLRDECGCTAASKKSPVEECGWQCGTVPPPPGDRPWIMTLFGVGEPQPIENDGRGATSAAPQRLQPAALDIFIECIFDKKNSRLHVQLGAPVERFAPVSTPPFATVFPPLPVITEQQQATQQQQQQQQLDRPLPPLPPAMVLCSTSIPDGGGGSVLDSDVLRSVPHGSSPQQHQQTVSTLLSTRVKQDSVVVVSGRPEQGSALLQSLTVSRWTPSLDSASAALPIVIPLAQYRETAIFDSRTTTAEIVCYSANNSGGGGGDDLDDAASPATTLALDAPPPVANSFLLILRGRHNASGGDLALFGVSFSWSHDWRSYSIGAFRCLTLLPTAAVPPAAPSLSAEEAEAQRRLVEKNAAVPLIDQPAPGGAAAAASAAAAATDERVADVACWRLWFRPKVMTRMVGGQGAQQQQQQRAGCTIGFVTHGGALTSLEVALPLTETSTVEPRTVIPPGVLPALSPAAAVSGVTSVSNLFDYAPNAAAGAKSPPASPTAVQRVTAVLTLDCRVFVVDVRSGRIVHLLPLLPALQSVLPEHQQHTNFPLVPRRIDVVANRCATVEFTPKPAAVGSPAAAATSNIQQLPRIYSFELFMPQDVTGSRPGAALVSRVLTAELHIDPDHAAMPGAGAAPVDLIRRVPAAVNGSAYDIVVSNRGGRQTVLSLLAPGTLMVRGRLLIETGAFLSYAALVAQPAVVLGAQELHILLCLTSAGTAEAHARIVFQEPEKEDPSSVNHATLHRLTQLADCCCGRRPQGVAGRAAAASVVALPALPDMYTTSQARGAVRYCVPRESVGEAAALVLKANSSLCALSAQNTILPFEESPAAAPAAASSQQQQQPAPQQSKGFFSRLFSSAPSRVTVLARNENVLQFIHLRPGNWAATRSRAPSDDADDFDTFLRTVAATTNDSDARARLMARVGTQNNHQQQQRAHGGGRAGAVGSAVSQANAEAGRMVQLARERGEQVERVEQRSRDLSQAAGDFAANAAKLNQKKSSWF